LENYKHSGFLLILICIGCFMLVRSNCGFKADEKKFYKSKLNNFIFLYFDNL